MRRIAALTTLAVLCACAAGATAATQLGSRPATPRIATCFWEGPISTKRPTTRGFDGRNFNFPEESATYWLARFNLPPGSHLELGGHYPHARYMSVNAYSDGAPTDALSDVAIKPRAGSTNPFIRGARRDLPHRAWRLRVVDAAPPAGGASRAPNTLYAKPPQGASIELLCASTPRPGLRPQRQCAAKAGARRSGTDADQRRRGAPAVNAL